LIVALADTPSRIVEAALCDPGVVARYRVKVLEVPGSDCLWWSAAVSGRGHGRFYVGTVRPEDGGGDGHAVSQDLCVIAHRFGYALVYGASALNSVAVLGHGCDNPLCQRIGPDHVHPSSHAKNRRAPDRTSGCAECFTRTGTSQQDLTIRPMARSQG
jgi:hypothetical protein